MTEQNDYTIRGHKVFLLGAPGSGKTYSIVDALREGVEVFVIFTEAGQSTLHKALRESDIPDDKLHWHFVAPAGQSFSALKDMATKLNTMTYELVSKLKDPNRTQYNQWIDVLETCANFVDDRTGESYGSVDTWNTDRMLVIDSLTGLNDMALSLIVGGRPTRGMQDWMVAQNNLYNFLQKLLTDLTCHFTLTGHLERETDEVTGGTTLMAATLGRKLAPRLMRGFDEVIMAKRNGDKFVWSTAEANADLKARILPLSESLPPSFASLLRLWKDSGGKILPTESA